MNIINTLQTYDPYLGFHLGFLIVLVVLILLWKSYRKTKSEFTKYFIYFFLLKNAFYALVSVSPFIFRESPEFVAKLMIAGTVMLDLTLIPLTILVCKLFLPRLLKPSVVFLTTIILIGLFSEIISPAHIIIHPIAGIVLWSMGKIMFWVVNIAHIIFMVGTGVVFIYFALRSVEKRIKIRGVLMGSSLAVASLSGILLGASAAIPVLFWVLNLGNGLAHSLMGVAAVYKVPSPEKASGKTE